MERWSIWCLQDGCLSWHILPWLLLGILSSYGSAWMDECTLDGSICWNNLWRKDMVQRHLGCKSCRCWTGNYWCFSCSRNAYINSIIRIPMTGSEDDTGDDMTMMILNDNANNNTNDMAMSDSSPKASMDMSDDSV